jgi:hypothetical protein
VRNLGLVASRRTASFSGRFFCGAVMGLYSISSTEKGNFSEVGVKVNAKAVMGAFWRRTAEMAEGGPVCSKIDRWCGGRLSRLTVCFTSSYGDKRQLWGSWHGICG